MIFKRFHSLDLVPLISILGVPQFLSRTLTLSNQEQKQQSLGIIVFGFKRSFELNNLLRSLQLQGYIGNAIVFLDGCLHRNEFQPQVLECRSLQDKYPEASFIINNGSYGIERLMIQGLQYASLNFENIVVLEDDCFPTFDAINLFLEALSSLPEDYFSVYGHPFGIEDEFDGITRFQGWGWATTRARLLQILPILTFLYQLDEKSYLDFVNKKLFGGNLEKLLDITPPRNCVNVMRQQFSWDSAVSLICADLGLRHKPTSERAIFNCGLGNGVLSGHFREESPGLRKAPYNMVMADEVWQLFHRNIPLTVASKDSFGLDGLDHKLFNAIAPEQKIVVELGAFDGITQSNSLLFERNGYRCLLIEPSPLAFEKLVLNRPISILENLACCSFDGPFELEIEDLGLMSMSSYSQLNDSELSVWRERAKQFIDFEPYVYKQKALPLSRLLEKHSISGVGLLSLDVEGYELQVLSGIDFKKSKIEYICLEVLKDNQSNERQVVEFLGAMGYEGSVINERNYTKDVLFRLK